MQKKTHSRIVERTAPSPTGGLHLGHVYSVLTAFSHAKKNNGLFKFRIEDIDVNRCKPEFEEEIISNLSWLGIKWDGNIMRQSERMGQYASAIKQLANYGLLYPCSCSRSDIKNASLAPHPEETKNLIYPGTCLNIPPRKPIKALRLNISKAIKYIAIDNISFLETGVSGYDRAEKQLISVKNLENQYGDIVIARQDIGTSYNLSVVIDDAAQMVTHVTRGKDLLEMTPIQVLLQMLLGLPTPIYHHHDLLYEQSGKKISKRSSKNSVSNLKETGFNPAEVIELAFNLKK